MEVDVTRALVPVQGLVQPLVGVHEKAVTKFSMHDQPRGGMRFLGYGHTRGGQLYGQGGRPLSEERAGGSLVNLYV